MKNIIAITLKEIISKRILHLGIIFTLLYLAVYTVGLHYILKDIPRNNYLTLLRQLGYQLMCLGLYISSFLAGALSILVGSGSISRDIESGTILSLASRPISRRAILFGKYCAYALVTIIYTGILAGYIVMVSTHYCQLAIKPGDVLAGISTFMLFPLVLLTVSHLASVSLSTMATGFIVFMLFSVSIIGGFIEQIGAVLQKTALINIGIITSLIMPADAVYRLALSHLGGTGGQSFLVNFGPFGVASSPSHWMFVYFVIYIIILLLLALRKFNSRDL